MATIKDDGVYRDADGNQFRFKKGHVVADGVEYKRVGDFPDSGEKAEPKAENKAAPAPANKASK